MKELLDRWCKLEPERIMHVDDPKNPLYQIAVEQPDESGGTFQLWDHIWDFQVKRGLCQFAILEATVQAIEARDWFWSAEFDPNDKPATYRAIVDDFSEPYEWIVPSSAASPAEALLRAYLTALEAQG